MPGKLCNGTTDVVLPRNSRAYCEGRAAAVAGALVGTNPHPANTPDNVAWAAGHASHTADPATLPARDCCADAPGGGYVAP